MWLTTIGGIDWPHNYAQNQHAIERQQRELCDILDRLQRAGINQVLLQTRIRATTIYPSAYEPWDGCLSGHPGTSPGYDALAYAIDQCHRRGMELHAWVVTIPVGKWDAIGCKRLRQRYPGLVRKIGPEGYLNPEKPQTATYLADICEEITRRYDVDGIHLDYIRYPETWSMRVSADRGRSYITHIVETIHRRVKPLKPYIKLSCAPIGKFDDLSRYRSYGWNAYSRVCQDAQGWLRRGLMDELFPMMYFRGEQFFPFAIDWSENAYGRIVAPGLGIYMLAPSEKDWPLDVVAREMQQLRYHRLGHTYFRSKFFTDDVKGIYRYAQHFDHAPALVPPMTWETSHRPTAPSGLNIVDGQLQWQHDGRVQGDTIYNVYASLSYPPLLCRDRHQPLWHRERPVPDAGSSDKHRGAYDRHAGLRRARAHLAQTSSALGPRHHAGGRRYDRTQNACHTVARPIYQGRPTGRRHVPVAQSQRPWRYPSFRFLPYRAAVAVSPPPVRRRAPCAAPLS